MSARSDANIASALICTRNRGHELENAVRSVLSSDGHILELIIIDQSSDDSTERIVEPFRSDPRVRYVRSASTGKGTALNLGLRMAKCDIVAITDDDCEVDSPWPDKITDALIACPRAALAYGNVRAPDYDRSTGWIPDYTISRSRTFRSPWQKTSARGIGANTAVRRKAILEIGGFDNEVGPGGKFRACIDGDMTYRCLLNGQWVLDVHESRVLHHGFRPNDAASRLVRNAYYGIGAAYVKPVKRGYACAIPVLLAEFVREALLPSVMNTLRFKRRPGWGRVISFAQGVRDGWKTPIVNHGITYDVQHSDGQTITSTTPMSDRFESEAIVRDSSSDPATLTR